MKIVFQQKKKKQELSSFIQAKEADADPTSLRNGLSKVEREIKGLESDIKDLVE